MKFYKQFLTLAILICAASKASASPEEDARYIASQFLLAEEVRTIRMTAAAYYVEYLGELLHAHNVKVKDPERLENLVPKNITDVVVEGQISEFTKSYLLTYDAQQLSQIRAFLSTGVWQGLKKFSYEECKLGDSNRTVIDPNTRGYEEAKIRQVLSPKEFEIYQGFFDSETGKAFGNPFETEIHCSDRLNSTSVFHLRRGDDVLRTEFVLNALETKGIFEFSNPVARRDFIAKIKGELQ